MANIINQYGQVKVGVRSNVLAPISSSLWNSLYSAYNADSIGSSSLKTSLFAAYNGESNTNDSFGANNGTAVGGLTYSAGKIGNAFTFNETNSYVRLPNNSLNFTEDFSYSFWVLPNISFRVQFFFSNYSVGNTYGYGYYCYMDNGSLTFTIVRGGDTPGQINIAHSWTQNWHHVVVTRKKSTSTKIYVNGVLKSGTYNVGNPTIDPVYQANQICNFGAVNNQTVNLFNGNIDAMSVWNKELTQAEVTELYNSGNGAQYITDNFYKPTPNDALNTYNGTAQGGLTYGVGKVGTAFQFNGTNSYILLPTGSMRFTNSFSVSMWTYATANQTGNKGLFSDYYWPGDLGYVIYMTSSNKVQTYFLGNGNTTNAFTSNSTLANNQWNHIVVSWDKANTQWKVYVNGVLDNTYTNANASVINYGSYSSDRTDIGAINSSPSGVANVFNGSIDAFNVWNRVLTQSEITELYNSGNGKQYTI